MKITGINNDTVKETAKLLQKKYREETGLFLIEGEKGIREAIDAGIEIVNLFVEENSGLFPEREPIETTPAVLKKISSTVTPPKAAASAVQKKYVPSDNLKKVILLENIKDAGNLGTILRTAAAFGADAVVLFGDTVDLYNPKCVRSAAGNLWKIPVFEIKDIKEIEEKFKKFQKVATLPNDSAVNLKDFTPEEPIVIMFGSEAEGLSPKLKEIADLNLKIEMQDNVESLNLSISAGVILYNIFMK